MGELPGAHIRDTRVFYPVDVFPWPFAWLGSRLRYGPQLNSQACQKVILQQKYDQASTVTSTFCCGELDYDLNLPMGSQGTTCVCFNFLFFFLFVRAGTKGNWECQREGKVKLLLEQDSCEAPSQLVPSFLASCSALSWSFLAVGKVRGPHQQMGRENVLAVICDYPEESVSGAHQWKAQSKCQ